MGAIENTAHRKPEFEMAPAQSIARRRLIVDYPLFIKCARLLTSFNRVLLEEQTGERLRRDGKPSAAPFSMTPLICIYFGDGKSENGQG